MASHGLRPVTDEGRRIDPADPAEARRALHDLLDRCLDRLDSARALPWQPPPGDLPGRVALGDAPQSDLTGALAHDVLPFGTGNTHPRFWGWVHGTGGHAGLSAAVAAATVNANLGGRHQGAVEVEKALIDWTRRVTGFPSGAFGICTTGTSQATVLALAAARQVAFPAVRQDGIGALPPLRVYAAEGAHSCVSKALQVMGHGASALVTVPAPGGAMNPKALRAAIRADRAAGRHPLAIVGTAGSVTLGTFDPFPALVDIARDQGLWLHADAAFGLWTRLAAPPWQGLSAGLERADSLATDFHKWIGAPYDCGMCLVRDGEALRRTFSERPPYLESAAEGLAAGETWFCDYGLELSRGFRALGPWAVIRSAGTAALGAWITDNCRQAALMGALAKASDLLDLAAPVVSNVCVFAPRRGDAAAIAAQLQLDGTAVFSTARVGGRDCLRAAIVNHRTTSQDVAHAMAAVEAACSRRP